MRATASETPTTPANGAHPGAALGLCCHDRREGDRAAASEAGAPTPDIAPADWSELFVAVTQRLRQIADAQIQQPPQSHLQRCRVQPASDAVRECAQALDQLHSSLLAQLAQRQTTGETLFERGDYA
jgi:hypothetical protein